MHSLYKPKPCGDGSFREIEWTDIYQAWLNLMQIPRGTQALWHLCARDIFISRSRVEGGTCIPGVKWLSWRHSSVIAGWQNFGDHEGLSIGSLGSLENPGLLCSETSLWGQPQTSPCGIPLYPFLSPVRQTQLPGIVGSLSAPPSPNPWAFGSQQTTVFTEVLWYQLSAHSSGHAFLLEYPSGPLSMLHSKKSYTVEQPSDRLRMRQGHCHVSEDSGHAQMQSGLSPTPWCPSPLNPQRLFGMRDFATERGTLSPNLSVCFYQPRVLPALLADKANYSLGRMLCHTFGAGTQRTEPTDSRLIIWQALAVWSKYQIRDSVEKEKPTVLCNFSVSI
jgi:hypothetical protein